MNLGERFERTPMIQFVDFCLKCCIPAWNLEITTSGRNLQEKAKIPYRILCRSLLRKDRGVVNRFSFEYSLVQNKGVVHLNSLGPMPCFTDEAAAYPAISPVCVHQGKFLITIKIVS
jgi:hypothetical protein